MMNGEKICRGFYLLTSHQPDMLSAAVLAWALQGNGRNINFQYPPYSKFPVATEGMKTEKKVTRLTADE